MHGLISPLSWSFTFWICFYKFFSILIYIQPQLSLLSSIQALPHFIFQLTFSIPTHLCYSFLILLSSWGRQKLKSRANWTLPNINVPPTTIKTAFCAAVSPFLISVLIPLILLFQETLSLLAQNLMPFWKQAFSMYLRQTPNACTDFGLNHPCSKRFRQYSCFWFWC